MGKVGRVVEPGLQHRAMVAAVIQVAGEVALLLALPLGQVLQRHAHPLIDAPSPRQGRVLLGEPAMVAGRPVDQLLDLMESHGASSSSLLSSRAVCRTAHAFSVAKGSDGCLTYINDRRFRHAPPVARRAPASAASRAPVPRRG